MLYYDQLRAMKKVQNRFFDLLFFIASFFACLYRSIVTLFTHKKPCIKCASFYDSIDYLSRIWPRSFWKKPTGLKIGMFFGAFISYIFYRKK